MFGEYSHFEDFQMKWACETLQRYRKRFCMFNAVIQGTAGVALAGLLGTVRTQGRPLADFANQKIVVVGAGSAGLGVLNMAVQAVKRMAGADANPQFFLLDKDGLITKARKVIDPAAAPFAKAPTEIEELGLMEGANLIEVVKKVKPHVLLGLSGVGGVFNEKVGKPFSLLCHFFRITFLLSCLLFGEKKDTWIRSECTAVDAFKHAGENVVFASGSPFKNVDLGIVGLGALLSGARLISDGMLQAASECLASYITDDEIQRGVLYPPIGRYAVVTGANKGIGFEICRQLASNGIAVVLTARDEKRGTEALEKLKGSGLIDLVVFHQLDVANPSSIASLADFVKTQFGKLDILVNNAGITGAVMNWDAFNASGAAALAATSSESWNQIWQMNWNELMTQTYEWAPKCLETNYYGAKRMIEAFLPLLQLSDSPRIVNVSSGMGKLKLIPSERVKGVLNDAETLTEDTIDELLNEFLQDFKQNSLQTKGWPTFSSAYIVSKAAMNGYTRILAKKYPTFRINCVCPGFVKTDINDNNGVSSVEEGAEHPVRLALLPDDGPTGVFFLQKEVSSFVE
ncbi:hypothetical protein RHMOL_Rhmol07G0021200 [Rhododendron molle]|uniref:Uncharacterized protein n=1 Tax=Rhododendron molle TaxID=49168 RepID=A0ACC0MY09_RHOML|nr:hypothetical protein RHMOL_Rhmol07G0021200 [Rhododendron molle]